VRTEDRSESDSSSRECFSRRAAFESANGLPIRICNPRVCAGNYRVDSSVAPYFAAAASFSIQAQTPFLSVSVSLASGCIVVYCQGGILAVKISPQMDSNLFFCCHCEYVFHSEKSNFSLPSRTCCAIHQETSGTWLYQGQSVRSEWQSPQARIKTCRGSIFNDTGIPFVLDLVATRRAVPACPTIRAAAANAAINFSVLIT